MLGHPIARRLTEQQLESVAAMTITNSDIYNARKKLRQQNLAGYTPIQTLVDKLQKENFLYDYEYDNKEAVTYLFFAHNKSVALTLQYPFKKEIDSRIEWEHINIPVFAYNNLLYANFRSKVSTFALKKINDQYQKTTSQEPLPPSNQSLLLNNVYTHWWIQGCIPVTQIEEAVARNTLSDMIDSPLVPLQNPHIVCTKERPSGAPNRQPANTTRQDSFRFEFVNHKARQCSICKQSDYNARTCPN
ncbi:22521_t:CDS:2 [Cetraspora pellucida]|uniref:22521_t:CDS:1 n=1 Tax=Cetraspora pellucida TaxID=1433469 RepID=A0A9N9G777_9GLOM|nr:22521_t:CDS:2 [Cetraspora pellucida]